MGVHDDGPCNWCKTLKALFGNIFNEAVAAAKEKAEANSRRAESTQEEREQEEGSGLEVGEDVLVGYRRVIEVAAATVASGRDNNTATDARDEDDAVTIVHTILEFTSSVAIVSITAVPMVCTWMYSSVAGSSMMYEVAHVLWLWWQR